MPIITILDLPLPHAVAAKALNFRVADWPVINSDLTAQLETKSLATHIKLKEEFYKKVSTLVHITSDILAKHLDKKCPDPFKKQWWTKELSLFKKTQNHLSSKLFKFWHLHKHPIHVEHQAAANKFKEVMHKTQEQDWKDW
jgi:hypothetical protein